MSNPPQLTARAAGYEAGKRKALEGAAEEICKRCQYCHGVQWPTGCIYCRPDVDAILALAKEKPG